MSVPPDQVGGSWDGGGKAPALAVEMARWIDANIHAITSAEVMASHLERIARRFYGPQLDQLVATTADTWTRMDARFTAERELADLLAAAVQSDDPLVCRDALDAWTKARA